MLETFGGWRGSTPQNCPLASCVLLLHTCAQAYTHVTCTLIINKKIWSVITIISQMKIIYQLHSHIYYTLIQRSCLKETQLKIITHRNSIHINAVQCRTKPVTGYSRCKSAHVFTMLDIAQTSFICLLDLINLLFKSWLIMASFIFY